MGFSNSYRIRNIANLSGGLNNFADPTEIADNEMAECENIEVDDKTIKTAPGYVMYGTPTADRYWGGFHARFSSGTQRLIRQRGTTLEYDNGSGTWTNCTLPNYASPATVVVLSQIQSSFEMLNDIVLFSNGLDSVMSSTDGITWTLRSSLPKSKKLLHNGLNRILYLAQTGAPSRIDWSDINDPLTINAASYQFIGKNDGDDIVDAVMTPTGGIFVNKTTRFYTISDITEGTVAVDPIGFALCVGRTAVATENSVMWSGPNGEIYEFDGTVAKIISGNISRAQISPQDTSLMCGVYFNGKYRLALPETTNSYNSLELVVNRKLSTGKDENPYVITRNRRNIGCYIKEDRFVSSIRRTRLYFGASLYTALFAYINDFRDASVTQGLNGAAQTCFFSTKFYQENDPYYLKRYVKSFIDTYVEQETTITFSYRFDKNAQWTDVQRTAAGVDIDFTYDDGGTGGFSEGYSFSGRATSKIFQDLEKTGETYGIQLKVTVSTNKDVTFYGAAYKFLTHGNFH